jgi:hypothetical protein
VSRLDDEVGDHPGDGVEHDAAQFSTAAVRATDLGTEFEPPGAGRVPSRSAELIRCLFGVGHGSTSVVVLVRILLVAR